MRLVDDLRFVEHVTAVAQRVGRLRPQVDEQMRERVLGRVAEGLLQKLSVTHLRAEMCDHGRIAWVLEQYHVVGVERHVARKLALMKQVLREKDDAHVLVTTVREQRRHVGSIARLFHQVVQNDQLSTGMLTDDVL